ncbi:MAG: hypothetical protein U0167_15460 [bacterium]
MIRAGERGLGHLPAPASRSEQKRLAAIAEAQARAREEERHRRAVAAIDDLFGPADRVREKD